MTVISDLCAAPFVATDGRPTGHNNNQSIFNPIRFQARMATTTSNAVLGNFILGTDKLAELGWTDITSFVRGVDLNVGNVGGQRPGAAVLQLTLANNDGRFLPTRSIYNGPGTVIQLLFYSDNGNTPAENVFGPFGPMFTGISFEWNEGTEGGVTAADAWVQVSCMEPLALLSAINENALTSLVGAGETALQRVQRIADRANWQFGVNTGNTGALGAYTLQGTDHAADALSELYTVGDSYDGLVATDGFGRIDVRPSEIQYLPVPTGVVLGDTVEVVADSVKLANNDDLLIGSIDVARAGGSVVRYSNDTVSGRYQYRRTQYTNLRTQNPGGDADLANYANRHLARGKHVYRPESVQLDSLQADTAKGDAVVNYLLRMHTGAIVSLLYKQAPGESVLFDKLVISGWDMSITPLADNTVHISATVLFGLSTFYAWSKQP